MIRRSILSLQKFKNPTVLPFFLIELKFIYIYSGSSPTLFTNNNKILSFNKLSSALAFTNQFESLPKSHYQILEITMISTVRLTSSSNFTSSELFNRNSPIPRPNLPLPSPNCTALRHLDRSLSTHKPLHISSVQYLSLPTKSSERSTACRAYEAESRPVQINIDLPNEQTSQKLKIGLYFATWWALNVVFNVYNKKVLNAFPYPWLTSTLSLAAGSLIMLASWATRMVHAPKTDFDFWKSLLPVILI